MLVKITTLPSGRNYAVTVDGVEIFANVRHPLPMLAGRLISRGVDPSTTLDFVVNNGPMMQSAPIGQLVELPRPRLETIRPYQRAFKVA